MPVPTTLADLSATLASNSPDGSEAVFPQLDNYLRAGFGLTAQLRDKLNGTDTTAVSFGGNLSVGGSLTVTGTTTLNGNMAFGNAAGDTLSVAPSAVTWSGSPTHSNNHTFSGNVTVSGNFTANGVATFASAPTGVGFSKAAYKTATTSRNSTTTLANDPHLTLSLEVGTWTFEIVAPFWQDALAVAYHKFGLSFSGTRTDGYFGGTWSEASTFTAKAFGSNDLASPFTPGASGEIVATSPNGANWIRVFGSIKVTVAGTFVLQWAQNNSSATPINLGVGSYMICTRIA